MKIREVIAGSILIGSLGGAVLGLGAGFAMADPPAPPPLPPPPPLVWAPQTPEPERWEAPPPQEEGPPLPPLPPSG
jgi:hypothetical protein